MGKRCDSIFVRTQVAQMGADAYDMAEFWVKRRYPELLDREASFPFFSCVNHSGEVEKNSREFFRTPPPLLQCGYDHAPVTRGRMRP